LWSTLGLHVTRAIPSFHNYPSPAWSGSLNASEFSSRQAKINKAVRYGFLPTHTPSVSDPFQSADQSVFQSAIRNPHHVLRQLFQPFKDSGLSLRSHSHQYILPTISTPIAKRVSLTECSMLIFTEFGNIVFL